MFCTRCFVIRRFVRHMARMASISHKFFVLHSAVTYIRNNFLYI